MTTEPVEDPEKEPDLRERIKRGLFEQVADATRLEDTAASPTGGDPADSGAGSNHPKGEVRAPVDLPLDQLIASIFIDEQDPHLPQSVLARGGMGSIELVHDRRLKRGAAMKIVKAKLGNAPWATRAFIAEAQVTAQLEHPNLVPVHALGRLEDGRMYFTMKLVRGNTLSQMVKALPPVSEGPLPRLRLFEFLEVLVKICDALSLAHAKGVFHCDIKPANIMIGDYGEVYLMDWGIAMLTRPNSGMGVNTSVRYEHGKMPFGTPSYMPPEQARGEPQSVDARTDVFGVGTLLYCILTRRHPYRGQGAAGIVRAAARAEFTPLDELLPPGTVPGALQRIAEKAMAVDKADRFQSAIELRDALTGFMRGEQSFPTRVFRAGETIVKEGEPGLVAYIIERGACEVRKTAANGSEESLRVMGPGEVFGETAVLTEASRTASVVATKETVVHVVSREAFEDALTSMSPWMSAFVQTLAERFRERETQG